MDNSNKPRLFSQWQEILFYSATIHYAEIRDAILVQFYDVILSTDRVSLTFDGVTLFCAL